MLARHPQHLCDDHDRQLIGERAHRFEAPAYYILLEQLLSDFDNARSEQRDPTRTKVARDQFTESGVHGRVGEGHRHCPAKRISTS